MYFSNNKECLPNQRQILEPNRHIIKPGRTYNRTLLKCNNHHQRIRICQAISDLWWSKWHLEFLCEYFRFP